MSALALIFGLLGWIAVSHGQTRPSVDPTPISEAQALLDRCDSTPEGIARFIIIPTAPIPKQRRPGDLTDFNLQVREGSVLQDSGFTSYVIATHPKELLRGLELRQLEMFPLPYKVYAADPNDHTVIAEMSGRRLTTFDINVGSRRSMRVAFRGGPDISARVIWHNQPVWPIPVGGKSCSVWALVIVSK